jgi:hypothetical protein
MDDEVVESGMSMALPALPEEHIGQMVVVDPPEFREEPTEPDPLAEKWSQRIKSARQYYKKYHDRVKHNRDVVQGIDWDADADSLSFSRLRANLIQGTITAMLPNIYAKTPEIAVVPTHSDKELKLFCKTIEHVTNRYLDNGDLKGKGKSAVRSAMTTGMGCLKVTYQKNIKKDPLIMQRIQDTQDNIVRVERLLMQLTDPTEQAEQEQVKAELEQTLLALQDQVEIVDGEGIVIDRILTENLIVDPAISEFWDYRDADWMVQVVPMKKEDAEGLFGYKLDSAKVYKQNSKEKDDGFIRLGQSKRAVKDDEQVVIYEIWDRTAQRVYTMADGCQFWLKPPYSPEAVGERWYPFFILPYQTVDGKFIGPSLVDLLEKLQDEHNKTRDKFNKHRDLIKPGYIASSAVNQRTVRNFANAELGEITMIETEGQNVQQVFVPKSHPPIDPNAYDTSAVRYDWEQVSGMQDAARSTVVNAKTATEANIMQQALSGRVAEFRDQVEDFLQDIAQYTAEILLLVLNPQQVEKICGQNVFAMNVDPMTGMPSVEVIKQSYDWIPMAREDVYALINLRIKAGSTGNPNKQEMQENWLRLVQVAQPLIMQIMQLQANGGDASVLTNLLKETLTRFDDGLELEDFVPKMTQAQAMVMQNNQLIQQAEGMNAGDAIIDNASTAQDKPNFGGL